MATRTLSFSNISLFFYRSNRSLSNPISFSFFIPRRPTNGVVSPPSLCLPNSSSSSFSFSTAPSTPYPLQYELIVHRPPQNPHQTQATHRRRLLRQGPNPPNSNPTDSPDSESETSTSELSQDLAFEDWADRKVAQNDATKAPGWAASPETMDKAKRKYYNKRNRRMYGSDSEDESRRRAGDGFVELRPEFVELKTLHKREEELYFYDALAYPWEKDKHYKMVYQLEKKYFPDQSFDRAFLQPGESDYGGGMSGEGGKKRQGEKSVGKRWVRGGKDGKGEEGEKGLIFFDEKGGEISSGEGKDAGKSGGGDKGISEKKVEEFFKCLKKVPSKNAEISSANTEPFLASRRTGLPPTWDSPGGTVVLINKPKGWTSFTVCGKLRRLVNVKKVGHAGTLDPMATGLLIVCVGKSTKLVDRYQGMIKGYTGIFRLGEATSTWDADSPVIQREPWEHIKDADIRKAAASFVGEIWQVPPMFSAIKVGGERMYDKARRGESVELSPRRISIFRFDIERSLEDRQNLIFRVICSKGTYIRSLCADIGKALGSCAHLTALRRESIGEYTADDAFEFQELEEEVTKGYM